MDFTPFDGSGFDSSPFGGTAFGILPIIFIIFFAVVIGLIIVRTVNGAKQWKKNNESPILTVEATVATKREAMHNYHHSQADGMGYNTTSTTYYATFEVQSGDRLEFTISGAEFGMLAEKDKGRLTFQGTRYLGFERSRNRI